jgi:capsular exopolysaccharide synthesis family protein
MDSLKQSVPGTNPVRDPRGESPDDLAFSSLFENSLRVLRRRYKLAIAVFVIFTVPATLFILQRPFTFQATARIMVERNVEASLVVGENRAAEPFDLLKTQAQMLRSRPIIAKTVERMKLWEASEFAPKNATAATAPSAATSLIDPFLTRLTLWQEPGTHVLNVTFSASEASVTSDAVTTLISVYTDEQTRSQLAASGELENWLKTRLDEQKARLDQSENALHAYMEAQKTVSVQNPQNIVVQKLADLNAAVTRAKTDRMAKETLFNQLKAADSATDVVESLPIALSNPSLTRLRAQLGDLKQKEAVMGQDLGDKHPDLIKLRSEITSTEEELRGALAKVTDAVRTEFVAAQALEQSLSAALEQQQREVLDLNRQSLDYNALQRQATADKQVYERLLAEAQARGITGQTPEIRIRVIEPAETPRVPVGPNRRRDLLLAACAGLFLAFSAPIFRESLDNRIKTPADIEKRLGLTCLTMVPIVKAGPSAPGPLLTTEHTNFNESFRRLRTILSLDAPRRGAVRLVVSSAAPRDGKTMVSVNLAMALAQTSERVLLVDGDLRRPKVHKMLQMSPFPGLADLLTGDAEPQDAIRPTNIPNLFVLTSGMKRMSSSELMSPARLDRLVRQIEDGFGWIVFDSPPIGAVADGSVLAQSAHRALLVVSADTTPTAAARAAAEQLRATGASIAGAILNRADLERAGFYYAPYYNSKYSDYYVTAKPKSKVSAAV